MVEGNLRQRICRAGRIEPKCTRRIPIRSDNRAGQQGKKDGGIVEKERYNINPPEKS